MQKNVLIGALLVLLGGGGAYLFLTLGRDSAGSGDESETPTAEMCAKHQIAEKTVRGVTRR